MPARTAAGGAGLLGPDRCESQAPGAAGGAGCIRGAGAASARYCGAERAASRAPSSLDPRTCALWRVHCRRGVGRAIQGVLYKGIEGRQRQEGPHGTPSDPPADSGRTRRPGGQCAHRRCSCPPRRGAPPPAELNPPPPPRQRRRAARRQRSPGLTGAWRIQQDRLACASAGRRAGSPPPTHSRKSTCRRTLGTTRSCAHGAGRPHAPRPSGASPRSPGAELPAPGGREEDERAAPRVREGEGGGHWD